jgi:hypothetical protein
MTAGASLLTIVAENQLTAELVVIAKAEPTSLMLSMRMQKKILGIFKGCKI